MSDKEKQLIADVHKHLAHDELEAAAAICDSLIEKNHNIEAMYIRSHFGTSRESEETFYSRRIDLLTKAANQGHASAMYELSIHLEEGDIISQDKVKALQLIQTAANLEHANATWRFGLILLYGNTEFTQDIKSGLSLIEKAAHLKSQAALQTLAEFYSKGQFGYPIDSDKSYKLLVLSKDDDAIPL